MQARIVVGLFQSKSEAEDAAGRLRSEGVPAGEILVQVLHDTGPVPEVLQAELAPLSLDPLVLGDVRRTFIRHIKNGETAVCVRAEDDAAVTFARDLIKMYAPVAIDVLPLTDAPAGLA